MTDDKMFRDPPAPYRAKPFWALNGKLEKRHLKFQIERMKEMGFGGAFLHARTGLVTEYMSEEWLDLICYAAKLLHENGMEAYLYDEDRWPSGTCGGLVTENPAFRAKAMLYESADNPSSVPGEQLLGMFALTFEQGEMRAFRPVSSPAERRPCEIVLRFFYRLMAADDFYNGNSYTDTMDRAATDRFLELTHEKYARALGGMLGKEILGVFTDEPHRGPFLNGFSKKEKDGAREIPYTPRLFEEFYRRRGYRLEERLPVLWFGSGEEFCKETYDLIETEQELFLENFVKPCREWCAAHKLVFTGHFLHEDNLASQTTMVGSVMRCYEFMDHPGMDNLTENNYVYTVPRLVASAARQLGKPFVLDELYAATGWKMRLSDYKKTGDWQSALGVTLRCPHLSWYTMKGEAKRDYPASILHQNAWSRDYALVETYFARLHYLMKAGEQTADTVIVNPVESTWGLTAEGVYRDCFTAVNPRYRKIEESYAALCKELVFSGCEADYLDEGIFAEHGRVEKDRLICGVVSYTNVILCENLELRSSTLSALKAFLRGGGRMLIIGDLPRYLDGVPHDFTADFASAERCGSLKDAVPWVKATEKLRIESSVPLIAARRKTEDGWLVFLLNPPECGAAQAQVRISSALACAGLDLRTGEREPIPFRREGGDLILERKFPEDGELMLELSDRPAPPAPPPATYESVPLPRIFRYALDEPNCLVLDRAVCRTDGEFCGEGYVLDLDAAVRKKFGLPQKGNGMIQPWFRRRMSGPGKKLCRLCLIFCFYTEKPPLAARLMTEFPDAEITLNGIPASGKTCGTDLDNCFRLADLPDAFRKGENRLEISFDYTEETDVESVYLCGEFGVSPQNVLTALPETLSEGDWNGQGLPYYSGTVTLLAPLPAGRYRAEIDGLGCALMKVNGESLAFSPYAAEFRSEGELRLSFVMTRRNLFGCTDEKGNRTPAPQGMLFPVRLFRRS